MNLEGMTEIILKNEKWEVPYKYRYIYDLNNIKRTAIMDDQLLTIPAVLYRGCRWNDDVITCIKDYINPKTYQEENDRVGYTTGDLITDVDDGIINILKTTIRLFNLDISFDENELKKMSREKIKREYETKKRIRDREKAEIEEDKMRINDVYESKIKPIIIMTFHKNKNKFRKRKNNIYFDGHKLSADYVDLYLNELKGLTKHATTVRGSDYLNAKIYHQLKEEYNEQKKPKDKYDLRFTFDTFEKKY